MRVPESSDLVIVSSSQCSSHNAEIEDARLDTFDGPGSPGPGVGKKGSKSGEGERGWCLALSL